MEIEIKKKEYLTKQAQNILKRTAQDIIDLSQICHEYHEEFGYQEYIRWMKEDLGLSRQSGDNLLNVFKQFGSMLNFSITDIQPSVLYLLSAPSTPEPAKTEILERAESGETVTHKEAKELVEAHKKIFRLESDIAVLKNKLPTEDILQKISSLEKQLADARNKPAEIVEVVPEGYEQVKADLEQAKARAKTLETSLIEAQNKPPQTIERVPDRYIKIEEEYKRSKDEIKKLSQKLHDMKGLEMAQMADKREVDAVDCLSEAHAKIKKAMAILESGRTAFKRTTILMNSISAIQALSEEFLNRFNLIEDDYAIINVTETR